MLTIIKQRNQFYSRTQTKLLFTLPAAQVSLVLQNVLIILSAAVIYCFLMFKEELLDIGEWTRYVAYALIIVLASAANLATIANTIAVEKDWIVEICNKDEEKLASKLLGYFLLLIKLIVLTFERFFYFLK